MIAQLVIFVNVKIVNSLNYFQHILALKFKKSLKNFGEKPEKQNPLTLLN